jgi:uncharacterized MnhB-related membrane protein
MIWEVDALLLLILLVAAVAALEVKSSLVSIILLGAYSFVMAGLFSALGAVDVALTEASLGAALTTIFYLLALRILERKNK